MGKFNKEMINSTHQNTFNVTAEMQSAFTNPFNIEYISINKLVENENNIGMTIDGIEELKQSIRETGLEQNLIVRPMENGKYKILTGHRRFKALQELSAEGFDKYNNTVPCIVKDFSEIDLPLPDDLKEKYEMLATNIHQRVLTTGEILKIMNMLDEVYDALKKQGYENLGKRRKFFADKLQLSEGTVHTYQQINKNIDDSIREDVESENISLAVAEELSKLKPKEQKKIKTTLSDEEFTNLTKKDVERFGREEEKRQIQKKKYNDNLKAKQVEKEEPEEEKIAYFPKGNIESLEDAYDFEKENDKQIEEVSEVEKINEEDKNAFLRSKGVEIMSEEDFNYANEEYSGEEDEEETDEDITVTISQKDIADIDATIRAISNALKDDVGLTSRQSIAFSKACKKVRLGLKDLQESLE